MSIVDCIQERFPFQEQIPGFTPMEVLPTAVDQAARRSGIGELVLAQGRKMNLRLDRCGEEDAAAVISVSAEGVPCILYRKDAAERCLLFPGTDPVPAMAWTLFDLSANRGARTGNNPQCSIAVERISIAQQEMAAAIMNDLLRDNAGDELSIKRISDTLNSLMNRIGKPFVAGAPLPGSTPSDPDGWDFVSRNMSIVARRKKAAIRKLRLMIGQKNDYAEDLGAYCKLISGSEAYRKAIANATRKYLDFAGHQPIIRADDAFDWAWNKLDASLREKINQDKDALNNQLENEVEFKSLKATQLRILLQPLDSAGAKLAEHLVSQTILNSLHSDIRPRLQKAMSDAASNIQEWSFALGKFCRIKYPDVPPPNFSWTELGEVTSELLTTDPTKLKWTQPRLSDVVLNRFTQDVLPSYTGLYWLSGQSVNEALQPIQSTGIYSLVPGLNPDLLVAYLVRDERET